MPDHKASDINGMTNEVFKNLPSSVYDALANHFTALLLHGGAYPKEWVDALVILLFKSGILTDAANYRPITLLQIIFKLFEYVLKNRLHPWLAKNPFMDPQQFGFEPGRSCPEMGLLVRLLTELTDSPVFIITKDFRKAFDSVPHSTLFRKIRQSPLPPAFARLLCSLVQGHVSILPDGSRISIDCGVLQGAILSPALFKIFINDLPSFIQKYIQNKKKELAPPPRQSARLRSKSTPVTLATTSASPFPSLKPAVLFADDTNLICFDFDTSQLALDASDKWADQNNVEYVAKKTHAAVCNAKPPPQKLKTAGVTLEWSTSVNITGITFTPAAMSTGKATLPAPASAKHTLSRIRDVLKRLNVPLARLVYNSYLRSTLLYGCEVFAPHPQAQTFQNEATSALLSTYRTTSSARKQLVLGLPPIDTTVAIRRLTAAMSYRSTRFTLLRSLIDSAIQKETYWGKMILKDLNRLGLAQSWHETTLALDSTELLPKRLEILQSFKKLVKFTALNADRAQKRSALFDAAADAEILPWDGIHPLCATPLGSFGYMILRDEFLPPHLLKGKTAPPPPPCPFCALAPDRPSHILQCPSLGVPATDLNLSNLATRWNVRDPARIAPLLLALKQRFLRRLAVTDKSSAD